jgi:hypothetical protein
MGFSGLVDDVPGTRVWEQPRWPIFLSARQRREPREIGLFAMRAVTGHKILVSIEREGVLIGQIVRVRTRAKIPIVRRDHSGIPKSLQPLWPPRGTRQCTTHSQCNPQD